MDKKYTILLVEDDLTLAKMYTIKFEKEGFNVIHADDGEKGLTLATTNPIDIILLDMIMPKIPGMMFLKTLRQHPNGKDVPVIVLSNLTDKDEASIALNLGVKEYLAKAMHTPEEVVEKVKLYLPSTTPEQA